MQTMPGHFCPAQDRPSQIFSCGAAARVTGPALHKEYFNQGGGGDNFPSLATCHSCINGSRRWIISWTSETGCYFQNLICQVVHNGTIMYWCRKRLTMERTLGRMVGILMVCRKDNTVGLPVFILHTVYISIWKIFSYLLYIYPINSYTCLAFQWYLRLF